MTAQTTQSFAEQLADAMVTAWNQKDFEAIEEYVADDIVVHFVPHDQDPEGIEALKQSVAQTHQAYPDYEWEPISVIDGDDRIVIQWRSRGTNEGEIAELAIGPTHETVTEEGVSIFAVEGEQVTEAWVYYDRFGPLTQLGVLPDPVVLDK